MNRRRFVAAAAATGTVGVAGCLGIFGSDDDSSDENGQNGADQFDVGFMVQVTDPDAQDEVALDASESEALDGTIVEYRWDVGDDGEFDVTSDDPVAFYEMEATETLTVRLEVEDDSGRTVTVTEETEVIGYDPAAAGDNGDQRGGEGDDGREDTPALRADFELVGESDVEWGEEVTLDASASVGDIVEYRWDIAGDGRVDVVTDGPEVTHTVRHAGFRTVTLEIEDSAGETSTRTMGLDVETDPEVVVAAEITWSPEAPVENEEVTFEVAEEEGDIAEYRWDLTDDGEFDVTSDEPEPVTHAFDEFGFHTVWLEVEGVEGALYTRKREVEVESEPA